MNGKDKDLGCVIDKYLYKFTFCLLKNIFLSSEESNEKDELSIIMEKINNNIIKDKNKYINFDYSIVNFDNIVNFIKGQNLIYVAEIIENLLIKIFCKVINVPKDETVNDYIYNNLAKIRNDEHYLTWFQQEKLKPKDLKNLSNIINNKKIDYFLNSPFSYLLYRINFEKYNLIKISAAKNSPVLKYIYNGCIPNHTLMDYTYKSTKVNQKTKMDQDISINSIMCFINKFQKIPEIKDTSVYNDIIRRFLYSVFIYYQTKNSPLINYGQEEVNMNHKKNLSSVPFSYNLNHALVEGRYSNVVISPIRTENRIINVLLGKNNMREMGMYELGKALVFNKNIKKIELFIDLLRSYYLDYFILGMGIYDNHSVNEINLALNYLKENCAEKLGRIIHKFKELKTLNLLDNNFQGGLAHFFVVLKNLYRNNETKIENLFLIKCYLNDASFFELGELLKNKFCKLKKLYIIGNALPRSLNFFKKLKKNKILTEIYIGNSNINKGDVDDIYKIISNTNIEILSIFKNKISNFKDIIRIIYRTRLIKKDESEKNINLIDKSKVVLKYLDICQNQKAFKSKKYIQLLSKIIEEALLTILDISKTLKDESPQKIDTKKFDKNYIKEVDNLAQILTEKKKAFQDAYQKEKNIDVDIKRLNEDGFDFKIFDKLSNKLSIFIHDKKADLPLYLLEQANKLIDEYINEFKEINEENKEKMAQKLANYIMLLKKKEELKNLRKKEELYNLIII